MSELGTGGAGEAASEKTGMFSGILQSLSQVLATIVAMGQTRLELFAAELQEEVGRAARLLLFGFVTLFAAGTGLFLGALALIFVFWDTHRVLVAVLVTGFFFLLAVIAALCLRNQLRAKPRLFDATLSELAQDKERLEQHVRNGVSSGRS